MPLARPLALALLILPLGVASTFAQDAAAADPSAVEPSAAAPRYVPTFAFELARFEEQLQWDGTSAERDIYVPRIAAGLRWTGPRRRLQGQSELVLGWNLRTGALPFMLRQGVLWERTLRPRLDLVVGADAALALDNRSPRRSFGEIGVPLGFRAGPFELLWRPHLHFRLAQEQTTVAGRTRTRRVRTNVSPLHLTMRFHFRAIFALWKVMNTF